MLLVFITVIVLILYYVMKEMRRPPNFPPGPQWLPIVGNLPELKQLSSLLGGQHLALSSLSKEYNTNVLGLKLGREYVVAVSSYPTIRQVLTSEEYEGRPDNFFLRLRCMGKRNGITCTEGEVWSVQRNFVNRHLRYLGFGKNPMNQMVQDEISEILQTLEKQSSDDVFVNKFLAPGIINVLWTLVTGERIPRDSSQLNELLDLFNLRAKAFDMTGGTLSLYPWLRFVCPEWSGYNLIRKINERMKNIFMKSITQHMKTWQEGRDDDLIYRYITEMKQNAEVNYFTEDQLVMICLDLFIAGSQTTSGTLDFAFLLMIMHPDIQRKVQQEIDRNLHKNTPIDYSDRNKVPYVEAVLLEIVRYRHVIPVIGPRRVLKDTMLDGYLIPKNTTVLLNVDSVHSSPEYWKNPDVFTPERFLDEQGLLVSKEKLIPFGLGRRRCLGEVLAKTCIFVFFTEILRNYDVSLAPGSGPVSGKFLPGITLSPQPYRAKFTKRQQSSQ